MSIYALKDTRNGKVVEYAEFQYRRPRVWFSRIEAEQHAAPNVDANGKPTLEVVEYAEVAAKGGKAG